MMCWEGVCHMGMTPEPERGLSYVKGDRERAATMNEWWRCCGGRAMSSNTISLAC